MDNRAVHIRACVFGRRYVVTVEPRTIDRGSLEFRDVDQARACASRIGVESRWPIIDHTERDE